MKFLNKIDGADKLITDSAHRTVTDGQISIWDDKLDIVDIADTVERNFDLGDEVSEVPTIDADLLGGKPPSYYLAGGGTGAGSGDMLKVEYDTNENGIVDNAEKVNGFTVEINVPANAKFTDTLYTHPATHPASMITGLPTSLPANGGNAATVGGFTVGVSVPADAVFTDTNTVTSINGKTGAITKADIVALGIPAQDTIVDISEKADKGYVDDKVKTDVPLNAKFTDTIYTHPTTHPASMITGLPTSLPANGGNADTVGGFTVGVDVPANAKFTDTNTVTSINGKTGAITKADIVALGIPASDTNTTYSAGTNIQINGTTISATDSKRDDSTSEFRVEVRTSDPVSPAIGRMWYRSDL